MSTETKPILVVGSINMDLVATTGRIPKAGETVSGTDFQVHPGGKGANQAVAVARLGYPAKMIGRVGSDVFGGQLIEHLVSFGVDTSGVAVADGSSGVATIAVAADGENSIIVIPGANAQLSPDFLDSHDEDIRHSGLVLAQLEIPVESVLHLADMCERYGVPLMLDPAPARSLPDELFPKLAWFTPNETEAAFFTDARTASPAELAHHFLTLGPRAVILKMGARGSFLAGVETKGTHIAAFPVTPVDTTAAGDAFNGAFATALMLGRAPAESARFASAAAAISVTRLGAQSSMPTRNEVEAFLRAAPRSSSHAGSI